MMKSFFPANFNKENTNICANTTTTTTRRRSYSFSRTQKWRPVSLLKGIWCLALVYGEVLVFYLAMWKCRWPDLQEWVCITLILVTSFLYRNRTLTEILVFLQDSNLAQPYHIALIADPQ